MNPAKAILQALGFLVWMRLSWSESECPEAQKLSLLQLKERLVYSSTYSAKVRNWNESTDCCRWRGVFCTVDGTVTGLDLSNEYILGSVDDFSDLAALTSLQGLNLSYNFFVTQKIPSSIHKLTSLKYLNLASVNLTGPINDSLSNLRFLEYLHLQNNAFLSPVPRFFANFTALRRLSLQNCFFVGEFFDAIFHLPSLEIINLSQNEELKGSLPEFHVNSSIREMAVSSTTFGGMIPNSIGNLRLLSLNLAGCQFSGTIPRAVFNISGLYDLCLDDNNLTGIVELDWIGNVPNLNTLSLSDNLLTVKANTFSLDQLRYLSLNGCNMKEFPVIGNQSMLLLLSLNDNHIEGRIPPHLPPTLIALTLSKNNFTSSIPPDMFKSFTSLRLFNVADNKLSGAIPSSLCDAVKLESLTLARNELQGSIPECLFGSLSSLNLFNAGNNQLSGSIPDTLGEGCALQSFLVSYNLLQGRIPKSLGNCKRLKWLVLGFNNLSDAFPCQIKQLSELSVLMLSSNSLYGDISCVGDWPALETMVLAYNNFTGFTAFYNATSMGRLKSLLTLDVAINKIRGTVPSALCSLPTIEMIDMSWNELNGQLPDCLLKNLTHLRMLRMGPNSISGSIPDAFPSFCKIESLSFDYNNLQGGVPRSLANCQHLEVLKLGNNNLSGLFPCHLKKLPYLRILSLPNNSFHGNVRCIESKEREWKSIRIVDLSLNQFAGSLPRNYFASWEALITDVNRNYDLLSKSIVHNKSGGRWEEPYGDGLFFTWKGLNVVLGHSTGILLGIDFSQNRFEGQIPESLGLLLAIHSINLSYNAFSGPIPSSLGNLAQLDSLDLSNNQLTGNIPAQFANLRFLQQLNLSMNQLQGRIPASTQLQTLAASSFEGNPGLCGPPLKDLCSRVRIMQPATESFNRGYWYLESAAVGFVSGLGLLWASLQFLKKWKMSYNHFIDCFASKLVRR